MFFYRLIIMVFHLKFLLSFFSKCKPGSFYLEKERKREKESDLLKLLKHNLNWTEVLGQ